MVHTDEKFDENPSILSPYYTRRPGLKKFLVEISQLYEIIVFTAGKECHADPLIKAIDKHNKYFSGVLYRSSCVYTNGFYVKDLRGIGIRRNLDKVIMVDDSLISMAFNLDNGIAISPYSGEKDDNELDLLGNYCICLLNLPPIKIIVKNSMRF